MIIILGLTIFIINILVLARDSREGFTDPSNNECSDFKNKVYKNLYSTDISGMHQLKDFKDIIKPFIQDAIDGNDTDKGFYTKYKNEIESLDTKSQKWLKNNVVDLDKYEECYKTKTNSSKIIEPLENEIGYTLKDVRAEDKKLKTVMDDVKNNDPDIESAINLLSGVDMNELNKLINKLNTFTEKFS
jgi:hypothetical protein